jgi:DNA-directed RNA polymerase specialized sigma24 family protein
MERLLKLALWRTNNVADAEDLIADAVIVASDPVKRSWPPTRGFLLHMSLVMRDLAIEGWRSARARHEVVDHTLAHDETSVDPAAAPDEALHHGRKLHWLRTLGARLRADRVADGNHPLDVEILDLGPLGIDAPAELAEALGRSVEEINEALRRLRYNGARIRAEYEAAEARRMAEARARAKKKREDDEP